MGLAYDKMGLYNYAVKQYQKAIDNFLHTAGKDHPSIATAYHNLGLSLLKKGLLDECMEYFTKSLNIKKKAYDGMNSHLAHLYGSISHALRLQGKYSEALSYQEKCLDIWEYKLGSNHPNLAVCNENIAEILKLEGSFATAIKCLEKALEIRTKFKKGQELKIAETHLKIGHTYKANNDTYQSVKAYNKALEIFIKTFGVNSPYAEHAKDCISSIQNPRSSQNLQVFDDDSTFELPNFHKYIEKLKRFEKPEVIHSFGHFMITCNARNELSLYHGLAAGILCEEYEKLTKRNKEKVAEGLLELVLTIIQESPEYFDLELDLEGLSIREFRDEV